MLEREELALRNVPKDDQALLKQMFDGMMKALFKEEGASLRIELLEDPAVVGFIDTHAAILDSSFETVKMSDLMRTRLQESDWIFSGMKTFHELNEAFPSLLDEDGNRKSFERFLNDVQSIDRTYNRNYLQAEYNFAGASAEMAARWEDFLEDEDEYYLQYRTAGDDLVRPEHAALHGVTLPMKDSFWNTYYPPNGWNCRCTVVQVLKDKYRATDHAEAMRRGGEALAKDKKGMFAFNPGKQGKTFPDYNPYTISKCRTCPKTELSLAGFMPTSTLCAGCPIIRKCAADKTKSKVAIERQHFMHEMEPLLKKRLTVDGNGHPMSVGFSRYGNKHLYSDTFGRSGGFQKEDLSQVDALLAKGKFIKKSKLSKPRKDDIKRFYYYEVAHKGKTFYFNVAEEDDISPTGAINHHRYLYSITGSIK